MSAFVAYTSVYEKRVGRTLSPESRQAIELFIAERPQMHPIVAGTGGVRKARWALPGKGKRGGARVIYFYRSSSNVVYFLDIYAKHEKADLSAADKKALKAIVDRLGGVQ
jgi:mRNA-degrading endonuclease RelE of RelBE toxin-antitoxin system